MNLAKAFQILEIDVDSSSDDIKHAYRMMLQVWHPDKFQDNEDLNNKAIKKTQDIIDAYTFIKNNVKPSRKVNKHASKKSDSKYQQSDYKSDFRYILHKNYFNTKKLIIKTKDGNPHSFILNEFSLLKNILSSISIQGKTIVCNINEIGMVTKIKSSNDNITIDYSNNYLPIKIKHTRKYDTEDRITEINRLDRNEIFSKVLDVNKPEPYENHYNQNANYYNQITYFLCYNDPNNSNSYYKIIGYDRFDNEICIWDLIDGEPNKFAYDNIINNNYECTNGFQIYEYDEKGRILSQSNPMYISIQEDLRHGLEKDNLLDLMTMMYSYDFKYKYYQDGSFIRNGINYYWQSEKKHITTVNFQNDNPVFNSIRNSDDETIEKATYDDQGRLIQIEITRLKHPAFLKFKKPKVEYEEIIGINYES